MWNDVMAVILILKVWRQSENPNLVMHIYVKNIPAKFHPNPIWNDRAVGFLMSVAPNKKWKTNSNIGSVPDPKWC